jgi:hypothetical protein
MRKQFRNIKRALVLRLAVVKYNRQHSTKLGINHVNVLFAIHEYARLTSSRISASQVRLFLCKINRSPKPDLINRVIRDLEDSALIESIEKGQRKMYSISIGGYIVLHYVNENSKNTRIDRLIKPKNRSRFLTKSTYSRDEVLANS